MRKKVPGVGERLAAEAVAFVQSLRELDLDKWPGVAETLDWSEALMHLGTTRLDAAAVDSTLGFLLKYQDDVDQVRGERAASLVAQARSETRASSQPERELQGVVAG